jgi:hypothetical protein
VIGRRDPGAAPAQSESPIDRGVPGDGGGYPGPDEPRHRASTGGSRRRTGLALGALALVIVLGAVGGFLYVRHENPAPDSAQAKAQVRQAYLSWWVARQKAYLQLSVEPMKPYMTAGGLTEEETRLGQQEATHDPLRLVADHNLQIAVYRDGNTASIDDVWVDHSVSLDPSTMHPVQQDPNLTIEDSTVLRKEGGHWLVDSTRRFGVSRPITGQTVSYAAVARGQSPPEPLRNEIQAAYSTEGRADASAFASSNIQPLEQIEEGPALSHDATLIQQQVESHQYVRVDGEHNYRIGIQEDGIVWVYDTIADYSVTLNRRSGKVVGPSGTSTYVSRSAFEFVNESGAWKCNYILGVD